MSLPASLHHDTPYQDTPYPNLLIASLTTQLQQDFLASCEQVELLFGDVIIKPGEKIQHAYFPTQSIISAVMPIDGSPRLEVSLMGAEGMHGIPLALGVDTSLFHIQVQGTGLAWRIDAKSFQRELKRSPALQQKMRCYIFVVLHQLGQTAACNRFHLVEQRLARWILMTRDRAYSDHFFVTHEFLAQMLGVRRVGVTTAAGALQQQNLISYNRGNIKIINSLGLEAASCSCYQADKDIYQSTMQ